jgi:DNA-directed RNA polymerase subunit omega
VLDYRGLLKATGPQSVEVTQLENTDMKAALIEAASARVSNHHILVNMVSRRVRQLSLGHRPRVQTAPGFLAADIALTEIIEGKIDFESSLGQKEEAKVVDFPGIALGRKRAA